MKSYRYRNTFVMNRFKYIIFMIGISIIAVSYILLTLFRYMRRDELMNKNSSSLPHSVMSNDRADTDGWRNPNKQKLETKTDTQEEELGSSHLRRSSTQSPTCQKIIMISQQQQHQQQGVDSVGEEIYHPPAHLLPRSPVHDISDALAKCSNKDNNDESKRFHRVLIEKTTAASASPLSEDEFVCLAQCKIYEPELEFSLRPMMLGKYSFNTLWKQCHEEYIPFLVWIYNGNIKWYKCAKGKLTASTQWLAVRRLLFALSRLVKLPNILFGFDNSDWSVPHHADPHTLGWLYTLPAVIRFVGSTSNPSFLWPTAPFLKSTAYCNIDDNVDKIQIWLSLCREFSTSTNVPWKNKKNLLFWRGSPTGMPLYEGYMQFLARPAFMEKFQKMQGYDIAFLEHAVPPYATPHLMNDYRWAPGVSRRLFSEYKMLITFDGHTSSWGLIEKLAVQSLLVIHESITGYREFYYKLLEPWVHYVPLSKDMSELDEIRKFIMTTKEGDLVAQKIIKNASALIDNRFRAQDMHCYLYRLLASLASRQDSDPTPENLKNDGIPMDSDEWYTIEPEKLKDRSKY